MSICPSLSSAGRHTHSDCPFSRDNVIPIVGRKAISYKECCWYCFKNYWWENLSSFTLGQPLLMLSLSCTLLTLASFQVLRDNLFKILHSFFINQFNAFYFHGEFRTSLFNPQLLCSYRRPCYCCLVTKPVFCDLTRGPHRLLCPRDLVQEYWSRFPFPPPGVILIGQLYFSTICWQWSLPRQS